MEVRSLFTSSSIRPRLRGRAGIAYGEVEGAASLGVLAWGGRGLDSDEAEGLAGGRAEYTLKGALDGEGRLDERAADGRFDDGRASNPARV